MNDRDFHRRGARAARPLTGRLDYVRALLENVQTHIDDMARTADAESHSRWVHAELRHLQGDVDAALNRARELRADMLARGLSAHALASPVPTLVLKRPAPPLMPIEATIASDDR